MPLPEIKISRATAVQAVCFTTLGFQLYAAINAISRESGFDVGMAFLLLVLAGVGVFVTTQKQPTYYQIFGTCFLLSGLANVIFRYFSLNWKSTAVSGSSSRIANSDVSSGNTTYRGGSSTFLGFEAEIVISTIQLMICIVGFLFANVFDCPP